MQQPQNHPGRIELGDDEPLAVDLTVTADELRIASTLVDIGTWPLHHCLIIPLGGGKYSIEVDGDVIEYSPDDDAEFISFLDEVEADSESSDDFSDRDNAGSSDGPVDESSVSGSTDRAGDFFDIDPGIGDVGLMGDTEPHGASSPFAASVSEVGVGTDHDDGEEEAAVSSSGSRQEPDDVGGHTSPARFGWGSRSIDPVGGTVQADDLGLEGDEFEDELAEYADDAEEVTDDLLDLDEDEEDEDDAPEFEGGADTSPGEDEGYVEDDYEDEEDYEDDEDDSANAGDWIEERGGAGSGVVPGLAGESLISRINELKAKQVGGAEHGEGAEPVAPAASGGGFLSRLRGESNLNLEAISAEVDPEARTSDTEALAAAVDALKLQPGDYELDEGGTVADAILASQRSLRSSSSKTSDLPDRLKKLAMISGVVILLAGLGLGGFVVIRFLVSSSSDSPPSTVASATTLDTSVSPTVPGTTVETVAPTTTGVPLEPVGFALSAPEFVQRWNATADTLDPQLRLPGLLPGEFDVQLTQYISARGSVGESGTVSSIEVVIDPTGPDDQDIIGIQALGVMIAAVDPNLSGPERKALLSSMGLNVDNPVLVGVDGVAALNGVQYGLVYDSVAVELRFRASG